jgi:hypothetical protein
LPEVEIVAMIDSPLEGLEKIKALKDVEEILEGADFFRIHASYLINMKPRKQIYPRRWWICCYE